MLTPPKSVYVDTTIPSFYFDDRESVNYLCDVTRQWWNEESRFYEIYLSTETLAELNAGDYPRKTEILDFARRLNLLSPDPRIGGIAHVYQEHSLMPEEEGGDALHLAYASFYRMDFLLTWNCNHLANANKKAHIRVINARMELFTPEIITPLELFSEQNL